MEEIERLNLDYYEQVLIYKSLTDERYLAQIIDHVQPEYFNDKNIKKIFTLIKNLLCKEANLTIYN